MREIAREAMRTVRGVLACLGGLLLVLVGWYGWMTSERVYYEGVDPNIAEILLNDPVGKVLGCLDPCIIRGNRGGVVEDFRRAAEFITQGARSKVIFDGRCASACSLLADILWERACITPKARFGFHMFRHVDYKHPERVDPSGRIIPTIIYNKTTSEAYSEYLNQWVESKGGFPQKNMLWMPNEEAAKYWNRCGGKDPSRIDPEASILYNASKDSSTFVKMIPETE